MRTVLDDLEPLGFDDEAYDALSEDLTLDSDNPGLFFNRVEMRLELLLKLYLETGKKDWVEMSKAVASVDPVLH